VVLTNIDDSIILDCYRLAAHYHIDPRIFLEMSINEVSLHLRRTAQLLRERKAKEDD
jgi:hypothetical protein